MNMLRINMGSRVWSAISRVVVTSRHTTIPANAPSETGSAHWIEVVQTPALDVFFDARKTGGYGCASYRGSG